MGLSDNPLIEQSHECGLVADIAPNLHQFQQGNCGSDKNNWERRGIRALATHNLPHNGRYGNDSEKYA